MSGAYPDDAILIRDKVAEAQTHFETIQRLVHSHMSALQEMLNEVYLIVSMIVLDHVCFLYMLSVLKDFLIAYDLDLLDKFVNGDER